MYLDFRLTTVTISYIALGHGYVYNASFSVLTLRLRPENHCVELQVREYRVCP